MDAYMAWMTGTVAPLACHFCTPLCGCSNVSNDRKDMKKGARYKNVAQRSLWEVFVFVLIKTIFTW